jgi:hypothetical protein
MFAPHPRQGTRQAPEIRLEQSGKTADLEQQVCATLLP